MEGQLEQRSRRNWDGRYTVVDAAPMKNVAHIR